MDLISARWRKSRRSGANGGDCVEVAAVRSWMAVRDSKDPDGPKLGFGRRDWAAFIADVKRGRHDR